MSRPSRTIPGAGSTGRRHSGGMTAVTAAGGTPETAAKRSVVRIRSRSRAHRLQGCASNAGARRARKGRAHDFRQVYLGRLHATRDQGIHGGLPNASPIDPGSEMLRLSGPAQRPPRIHHTAVPTLCGRARSVTRSGTTVARLDSVHSQGDPPSDDQQQQVIYRFSVQRGMAVALVIETPDWYSGLLQAALARIRIEGHN